MQYLILWCIVFIVAIIAEVATASLVSIWFCFGSIVALIANLLGATENIQIILFFTVSFVSFCLLYEILKNSLLKSKTKLSSNIERNIGKTGKCIESIDNITGKGMVIVDGVNWSARTETDEISIVEGDLVEILKVEGVKVIVRKKEKI